MEVVSQPEQNIREIEDIIDIQKANGNFDVKQVSFNVPSKSENRVSTNFTSFEFGLSTSKLNSLDRLEKKKTKKTKSKCRKSSLQDVFSWPSDSDVTVLRMKMCLKSSDLKEKVINAIPGDGLHQPDSSSMVNLATLMNEPQPPSKQSLIEEYLLPLSSWENGQDQETGGIKTPIRQANETISEFRPEIEHFGATCSNQNMKENMFYNDSEYQSELNGMSKVARFLRLYFCPCCTCLYKMEKMNDEPSTYWSQN